MYNKEWFSQDRYTLIPLPTVQRNSGAPGPTIEALEEIDVASWLLGARGVGWLGYYPLWLRCVMVGPS